VLLALLLLSSLPNMRPLTARPSDLTITVDGEQFWWRVRYLPPDREAVETANEIRVPVGRTVTFALASPARPLRRRGDRSRSHPLRGLAHVRRGYVAAHAGCDPRGEFVWNSAAAKPGSLMPAFDHMSAEDAASIAAYLLELR